jgi:hypothetical protein
MEKIEQKENNKNERNRPEAMHPLLSPYSLSKYYAPPSTFIRRRTSCLQAILLFM